MRYLLSLCAIVTALALTTQSAPAADKQSARGSGAVISGGGKAGLIVTVNEDAAIVHFTYESAGCPKQDACLTFTMGSAVAPIHVSSVPACKIDATGDYGPTRVECEAASIGGIKFVFQNGGAFTAYEGGDGQHEGGCSSAPLTVQTGGETTSVNLWNGCQDSVDCPPVKNETSVVDIDATDVVKGKCTLIHKH